MPYLCGSITSWSGREGKRHKQAGHKGTRVKEVSGLIFRKADLCGSITSWSGREGTGIRGRRVRGKGHSTKDHNFDLILGDVYCHFIGAWGFYKE